MLWGKNSRNTLKQVNNPVVLLHSEYLCLVSTKYKGIDDDSGYGGANYKAKNHIDGEVGCKRHGDSKHSLQSDGQQQDETSAVPCTERGADMSWHVHMHQ